MAIKCDKLLGSNSGRGTMEKSKNDNTDTQSMICYWCNNKTVVTKGANLTVIQGKGKVHRFVIA